MDTGLHRRKKDRAVEAQGPGLEVMRDQEGTHEMNLEVSERGTAREGKGWRGPQGVESSWVGATCVMWRLEGSQVPYLGQPRGPGCRRRGSSGGSSAWQGQDPAGFNMVNLHLDPLCRLRSGKK